MVAPVAGPFYKTQEALGPPNPSNPTFRPTWLRSVRTWYRQAKPYTLPLTYEYDYRQVVFHVVLPGSPNMNLTMNYTNVPYWTDANLESQAYNKAYDKFVSKLKDSPQLAVNYAERRQALGMLERRFTQLLRFSKAIRKGKLGDAAKALGVRFHPRTAAIMENRKYRRGTPQNSKNVSIRGTAGVVSDLWLEFHFGLEPLVKDVHAMVQILQGGVPPARIRARAEVRQQWVWWGYNSTGSEQYQVIGAEKCGWTIQADIIVSNPNLWLANQLGVVNPAAVAWELIPFSFLVDYVVNVGKFLESFTDFWGLTLLRPSRGYMYFRDDLGFYNLWRTTGTPPNTVSQYQPWQRYRTNRLLTKRIPGSIPGPTLRVTPWTGLSASRAATIVSLLVKDMLKK